MKDFEEFVTIADSPEEMEKRERVAIDMLDQFLDPDGTFPMEQILNATSSMAGAMCEEYLRLYHKWLNE